MSGASILDENPDADPYPERLHQVRQRQGRGPRALLLRPGEGVRWLGRKAPELLRQPGFTWPFEAPRP